ncbi:hypothetical protein ACEPAG_2577 [Sanghuangporus baumii]
MEIIWVRWFQFNSAFSCGFAVKRLPRLKFVLHSDTDMNAFGFINPDYILRGAHLIPFFHGELAPHSQRPSVAHQDSDNNKDYLFYCVNIFVDRDMFMRYKGGGIRHLYLEDQHSNLLDDIPKDIKEEMERETDDSTPNSPVVQQTLQEDNEMVTEGEEEDKGGKGEGAQDNKKYTDDEEDEEEEDMGGDLDGYAEL